VGEKKRRARGINAAVMGGDPDASQCVEWGGEMTGHALEFGRRPNDNGTEPAASRINEVTAKAKRMTWLHEIAENYM
jgi:hypothetical protein